MNVQASALATLTEKAFQAQIEALAQLLGWRVHHHYDARRSTPGYPDLTLVKRSGEQARLIFAELKVGKNTATPSQAAWLADLGAVGGRVEVYCWRPENWAAIERALALEGTT